MGKNVVVLGATVNRTRFANRAVKRLREKGYTVIPVNPLYDEVEGLHCYKALNEIAETVDTVTVYVNPERVIDYSDEIISANPRRVILNPGTENSLMDAKLKKAGISVVHDCTLMMLDRDEF